MGLYFEGFVYEQNAGDEKVFEFIGEYGNSQTNIIRGKRPRHILSGSHAFLLFVDMG